MNNSRIIISEEIHNLINENFAKKVFKTLEDYNVPLKYERAEKLIDYEILLTKILFSDSIELEEGSLFNLMGDEEKETIMEKVRAELEAIDMIKNVLLMEERFYR